MRSLVISELVTLDGVMEAPGGEPGFEFTGWSIDYVDSDYIGHNLSVLDEAGALLLGRLTYESFAGAFAEPDPENPFSVKMGALAKYVVSSTLQHASWPGTEIISNDVVERIQQLKAAEGKPILVNGSRELVQLLFQHDLVNEIRLLVHPVILGMGRQLFAMIGGRKKLELLDSKRFASGIVALHYRVLPGI